MSVSILKKEKIMLFYFLAIFFGFSPSQCIGGEFSCETIFTPLFGPERKHAAESHSGDGSDLIQTQVIRKKIPELLGLFSAQHKSKRIPLSSLRPDFFP